MKNHKFPISLDPYYKSEERLKSSYLRFLSQPFSYRKRFLQSHYKTAFDGYSYMGQANSTNQYDYDLLHSFVLSDFQSPSAFPLEFSDFFHHDWHDLKAWIVKLETRLLRSMNLGHLEEFYKDCIGHMISCNYYPKPSEYDFYLRKKIRLSAHKDVSLFTTFPFGLDKGFAYYTENDKKIKCQKTSQATVFPGYFFEWFTAKKSAGLNHLVEIPEAQVTERFSFAVFSIPKPKSTFVVKDERYIAEDYYQEYLSLF